MRDTATGPLAILFPADYLDPTRPDEVFSAAHGLIDPADTPRIACFDGDIDANAVNSSFRAFMVKDHVKSAKDQDFPARVETPLAQAECSRLSERFRRIRGEHMTGGIVCKEYVELARHGGRTNEWRAFYLGGEPVFS